MPAFPKYSITGRVTSPGGEPVAGAKVLAGGVQWGPSLAPPALTRDDGRFYLPQFQEGVLDMWYRPLLPLLVTARGFAPVLVELPVQPENHDLDIRLAPGNTLRGKIVDVNGSPVQDVLVAPAGWRTYDLMDWRAQTDAQGRFEWHEAPPDAVLFDFGKTGHRFLRDCSLAPSEEEHVIVLRPLLEITGRIFNAQTEYPVPEFTLSHGMSWPGSAPSFGTREPHDNRKGRFSIKISEPAHLRGSQNSGPVTGVHLVRIEAGGFLPAIIRAPDGIPVMLAALVVGGEGSPIMVTNGKLDDNRGKIRLITDHQGRVIIPPQVGNPPVVITHRSGIWQGKLDEIQRAPEVRLLEWATVKVETSDDVLPRGDCPFYINMKPLAAVAADPEVYFECDGKITRPGLVVFESLPPGPIRVGTSCQDDATATELLLKSGETVIIAREKELASFSGRVDLPALEGIAWEKQRAIIELKHPDPPWLLNLTLHERKAWLTYWLGTAEGKAWKKKRRIYFAKLNEHGVFRFEAIVPGIYNLEIPIFRERPGDGSEAPLAGVVFREVKVYSRDEYAALTRKKGHAYSPGMTFRLFLRDLVKDFTPAAGDR